MLQRAFPLASPILSNEVCFFLNSNVVRTLDRRMTDSVKWDGAKARFGGVDVLPFWVADMDFGSPDCVVAAVAARAAHGSYGYSMITEEHKTAFAAWMANRHHLAVDTAHVVCTPGVITSMCLFVRTLTKPGAGVVVMPPVYAPFFSVVRDNGRRLVEAPLLYRSGVYEMDYGAIEGALRDGAQLVMLCSPHNPAGRVWHRSELEELLQICGRYNVPLVSDEIHADFVMPSQRRRHISTLTLPGASGRVVSLFSATKTFNLGGLAHSTAVIPQQEWREAFVKEGYAAGALHDNLFGAVATTAAYREGGPWVDNLLPLIDRNRAMVEEAMADLGLFCAALEGTYLMWLNVAALGIPDGELEAFFAREAGVGLQAGVGFGAAGTGWVRFNVACPEGQLRKGLSAIAEAVKRRRA